MAAPQYVYDPITQSYKLVQQPIGQQPAQTRGLGALYPTNDGGADASMGTPGSGTPGSGGVIGDMALSAYGATTKAQEALGPFSMAVPGLGAINAISTMGVDKSIDVNEQVGKDLATLAEQANVATVTQGPFGPVAVGQVDISPVAAPVAPQEQALAALASMNAAQQAETEAEAQNAPDSISDAIASIASDPTTAAAVSDAVADAAVSAAATADTSGGTGTSDAGGGGDAAEGTAGVGDEGGHSADGNNSGDGNGSGDGDGERAGGMIQLKKYAGGGYASPSFYPYSQPAMMAEGGLAAAKRTQDAGRGPDTMLVHMAPQEVAGLQALAMAHGGSLTINPKTGLPEAGFLSSLLPTLVGAALTVGSGGAINPYMAAGIVGGLTGVATGSLKKGLFAGLGAFGGANIGSGLSAAAGPEVIPEVVTPTTPMTSPLTQVAPETMLTQSGDISLANLPAVEYPAAAMPTGGEATFTLPSGDVTYASQYAGPQLSPQGGYTGMGGIPAPEVVQAPPPVTEGYGNARDVLLERGRPTGGAVSVEPTSSFERAGKGLQNVFAGGEEGKTARTLFGEKAGYGSFSAAAAPVLTAEPEPLEKRKAYIRPYDLAISNRSAENAPLYGPGSTSGREMVSYNFSPRPIYEAAGGGLMSLRNGGTFDDEPGYDGYAAGGLTAFASGKEVKKSKKLGGDPYYKFSHSRKDTSMEAALDANFAKGGSPRYLNGAGDGMSDDIPAIIDGRQPARLADGEFVIPADVVSHLGNGSSKAGAKKLYSMMDRIRRARTGKKSQAPEVKSERYMPA